MFVLCKRDWKKIHNRNIFPLYVLIQHKCPPYTIETHFGNIFMKKIITNYKYKLFLLN